MTTKDYTANVISATKVVPDGNFKDSKASGVWNINEALDLIKGGNWPNVANLNPAAFVDALFSCDVWTSDGSSAQTITNNIDLSGKGGLVWIKDRSTARNHVLVDTVRQTSSADNYLISNSDSAAIAHNNEFGNFSSTGYTVPYNTEAGYTNINTGRNYVGWSFRKQPKFFDVVTYTGDASDQVVSHSLQSTPGMIIIKATAVSDDWTVYHRGLSNSGSNYSIKLNSGAAESNTGGLVANSSTFTLYDTANVNTNGRTYVAYLFAHNDNDGGFGEPGDQDIIKCGSYTGNTSTKPTIDLGFEPQWLMLKNASSANQDWQMIDTTRGWYNGTGVSGSGGNQDARLRPNATNAEEKTFGIIDITPTGFKIGPDNLDETNKNGDTIIYMAIRRGGMQTPTAASDVFAIDGETDTSPTPPSYNSGFPVDLGLFRRNVSGSDSWYVFDRLRGNTQGLITNATDAEQNLGGAVYALDRNDGVGTYTGTAYPNAYAWMWKRARGYFDIVTTKSTNGNVNHNLGVVPEMVWYKRRSGADDWFVCTATDGYLFLNQNARNQGYGNGSYLTNAYGAQATSTTVNTGYNFTGVTTADMVIYLFATVSGVSKVGSFTQSGATNVDCGFTGDTPSFLLLKRIDTTDNWRVFDSTRGLVAGNDKVLNINRNAAQSDDSDLIDPNSGGFATTSNLANGDYIFYAIAATS